jgi:hypothetical protein
MKCSQCNKEMVEEVLFTSIEYRCKYCSDDGWQSVDDMRSLLSPMDFPIKLKFKEESGREGSVFVGDIEYFTRCPKTRKFKIQSVCDPYIGLQKGMTESEVAKAIYGYSIDSDDDGC